MRDIKELQRQLEQVLDALVTLAESNPDVDLAEAADHISAALTRLEAASESPAAPEDVRSPTSSRGEAHNKLG